MGKLVDQPADADGLNLQAQGHAETADHERGVIAAPEESGNQHDWAGGRGALPSQLGYNLGLGTGLAAVRKLWGLILIFIVVSTLLVVNVVQALSLSLIPFSGDVFARVNGLIAQTYFSLLVWAATRAQGIKLHLSGDAIPENESALIFCNHASLTDVLYVLAFAGRHRALHKTKWFVKEALRWVPGVGWGLWFLGTIFLRRNWAQDERSILATFAQIRTRGRSIWVGSFVEGTRQSPEKLRQSQAYARTHELPALQYLLLPRTKGFTATLAGLRGHLQAVYDLTLAYRALPSLWDVFLGRTRDVYLHVRRHPLRELPSDGPGQAKWLMEQFAQKDAQLAAFARTGQLHLTSELSCNSH